MKHYFFAVCLTGAAGVVFAQAPSSADQTVVVTASRAPEPLDNTLWSTTVLTRADIEARQPSSLQELLGDLAGINIVNNGGLGKVSNVLMRGAESEHTLLLVDGVRVASATAGTAPFEFIPLEQIDRVEVVRGPRSTLYGSDALGGVIQIFTRHASQSGFDFGTSIGGGSHHARRAGADIQVRGERAWLSAEAEAFDTDGFNSCSTRALSQGAGCFAAEPDADGYRNNSGSLSLGYEFNDRWSAQLHSLLAEGRSEFDGFFNRVDFTERVAALNLDGRLGGSWQAHVQIGRDEDQQQNLPDDFASGKFDTTRDAASVQLDGKPVAALRLIAGADYQRDRVASNLDFSRDSRDTRGVFAELHGDLAGWATLAGARYEDNEQFGGHVVGNVGVAHRLGEHYRLSATWGTAFHAPTFNDLYYPFGAGNPDLSPEESRSFEIGLDSAHDSTVPLHWSLHAFQTTIEHLIALDSTFFPINLDESRIRGAELQAEWRSEVWKVGGQYTQLDPINRSGGDLLLPRRAKQNASLQVRRLWPSLSVGAVARYEGARFDDLANNRPLGGFVTLDLAAEQEVGRSLTVQARVANLFDRDYSTAAFYLQDGRNYQATLRYRFAPEH